MFYYILNIVNIDCVSAFYVKLFRPLYDFTRLDGWYVNHMRLGRTITGGFIWEMENAIVNLPIWNEQYRIYHNRGITQEKLRNGMKEILHDVTKNVVKFQLNTIELDKKHTHLDHVF